MKIDVSTKTYPNQTMLIDSKDYLYLKSLGVNGIWAGKSGNTFYAMCRLNSKKKRIHRLLMSGIKTIDHINHNGLDNRRFNLRPIDNRGNQSNRINQGASKYVGVRKARERWRCEIQYNKVKMHIGTFDTEIEAAQAYQDKLKELKTHSNKSA